MAQLFPDVISGDLITADQMNKVLHELSSLDDRVSALENSVISGTAVVINDLIPPSGTLKVGDVLIVQGKNFGFSSGALRAYIDDLRINAFNSGTDDANLVFNIPITITNVPPQGRPALLTVSNATSSTQRTLTLQPPSVLTGALDVVSQGVSPATITAGQPATFAFLLTSRANLDGTFALTATISVAAGQATWQSNVQLLDSNQSLLTNNQIMVPAGQSVPMFVRIGPVPPNTNGTAFSLQLDAVAGGVTGSSGQISGTVGSAADQPDTTIKSFNFASSKILGGAGTITNSQIQLSATANAAGGSAKISLHADFTVVGNYDITISLGQGATNWQANPLASTTPNPYPITSQDLSNPQGIAPKILDFFVQAQAGATAGQITFQLHRQGITQTRKFTMALATQ